jgi:hypothetical protein
MISSTRTRAQQEGQRRDVDLLEDGAVGVDLAHPDVHPVRKAASVLADLEAWRLASGRRVDRLGPGLPPR